MRFASTVMPGNASACSAMNATSRWRTSEATTRWLCAPPVASFMRARTTFAGTPSTAESLCTTSRSSAASGSASTVRLRRFFTSALPSASQMKPRGAGVDTVVYRFSCASAAYMLLERICMLHSLAARVPNTAAEKTRPRP